MGEIISFTLDEQRQILGFVRSIISCAASGCREPEIPAIPRLDDLGGCFVTIREGQGVRGCIGTVEAFESLGDNLRRNAENAAFADPVFPPVEADELRYISIEVSIISPPQRVSSVNEIVPGRDGVIMMLGGRRAVLLPQSARENRWDLQELLQNIALKTSGDSETWHNSDAVFYTFRCETFSE